MVETSRAALLDLLVSGYDDLRRRLTRRLGSGELAGDALQDTFLRLKSPGELGPVRSPRAYLFRIAMRVAASRRIVERRRLTELETEALLAIADDAPDPSRVVEARSEIEALKRALRELPARRREIVLAACMEEIPHRAIAERFGVSVRTIQIELKQALAHCALRLERDGVRRSPRTRDPFPNGEAQSVGAAIDGAAAIDMADALRHRTADGVMRMAPAVAAGGSDISEYNAPIFVERSRVHRALQTEKDPP